MIWPDEKLAGEHYMDLLNVREHVAEEFLRAKESGELVSKETQIYRMKIIDRLIEDARHEGGDLDWSGKIKHSQEHFK